MRKICHILALGFLLLGCSSEEIRGKTEAEILYKEALELMGEERFILATEKLNMIRSQYPYSFYATHAELLGADILFLQESYVEAAAAYVLFRDFHPKHEKLSYVIWRIGESYFNQLPSTFDRDLSPAYDAIKYYNELMKKFPNFKEIPKAKENLDKMKKMLKDKERYIADFYYKTDVFDAAKFRYLEIIKNHPNDTDLLQFSKYRVVLSAYYHQNYEACLKYFNKFKNQVKPGDKASMTDISKMCSQKYKEKIIQSVDDE